MSCYCSTSKTDLYELFIIRETEFAPVFFSHMKKGRIIIRAERCKACLLCIEVCKNKGIKQGGSLNKAGYVPVERDEECDCNGCALCAVRCPEIAVEVYRDE